MQDLGPDMEELLYRASEEYPLKEPGDKWQAIQEAIDRQRVNLPVKPRYLNMLLPPFFLVALVLIGLAVGDAEKKTVANRGPVGIQSSGNNTSKQIIKAKENTGNKPADHTKVTLIYERFATTKQVEEITTATQSSNPIAQLISYEGNILRTTRLTADVNNINSEIVPQHIEGGVPEAKTLATIPGRKSDKGIYYGVLAGLDVNAIKDQPFGNSNFEVGAIVGYRFNKILSLESGVSLVKKYYTTKGKYFSMDEMSGMPGAEMMEVKGSSKIIRIPLHVRTDLINKLNYRIFSSLGISSYIMTEENNQYQVMMNGTEDKMFGSYMNDRNYFAATIDIAVGIEKRFGNKNYLGVHPYLQLPVRGIGVGRLPVRSAGLRVSLTHSE
jgi:hypothetical protein